MAARARKARTLPMPESHTPTHKHGSKPALNSQPASRISVDYRRISELKLNPHNPRVHSAKQIRQIASSIEKFGFNVPVLVDAQDTLITGEGRVLACQLLGWTDVPTIRLDHRASRRPARS